MSKRRQSHKGRARNLFQANQGKKPPSFDSGVPFFSFENFPVIRKRLIQEVKECQHRKNTGRVTSAPCCRVEQGRIFECTLYGHEPAKLYDCINCKRTKAIEDKEQWIQPLVQLSKGNVPAKTVEDVKSVTELPGRLHE